MVDQHRLLTQPEAPTILANVGHDLLPDRTRKGWSFERRLRLTAATACDLRHRLLGACRNLAALPCVSCTQTTKGQPIGLTLRSFHHSDCVAANVRARSRPW